MNQGWSGNSLNQGRLLLWAACLLVLSCSRAETLRQPAWKSDNVKVVLHRSASFAAPENTIPALEEAVRQGADAIEIDIRKTLDGAFVLFHDDWLICHQGAGAKVEHLTLAEARSLDVGSRWGAIWKGLKMPLLQDVFSFAKRNSLQLFLDIKTNGIEAELKALINEAGIQDLVIHPARMATGKNPVPPYNSGWNYLDGGEEDPAIMQAVAQKAKSLGSAVMVDDARALVLHLGRKPVLRPFSPYVESAIEASSRGADLVRANPEMVLRRRLWKLSQKFELASLSEVKEMAASHPTPEIRLDAIWALGAVEGSSRREVISLLAEIAIQPEAKDPKGMAYFPTFRQGAAACALARLGAKAELKALSKKGGFLPAASVLGATVFDKGDLVFELLSSEGKNSSLSFALSFAALHPKASELYMVGLKVGGFSRKAGVFGLTEMIRIEPGLMTAWKLRRDRQTLSGLKLVEHWLAQPSAKISQ